MWEETLKIGKVNFITVKEIDIVILIFLITCILSLLKHLLKNLQVV